LIPIISDKGFNDSWWVLRNPSARFYLKNSPTSGLFSVSWWPGAESTRAENGRP